MIEFNATFLVAMLSFIVFMFIMNTIFYNPILNIIRKRENYIESNLQDAKVFNTKTEEYNAEHEEKLGKAKEEGRKKVVSALDAVQKETFAKTQAAKENAKNEIQSRKEILLKEKEFVQQTIKSEKIEDITKSIVSKIMSHKG